MVAVRADGRPATDTRRLAEARKAEKPERTQQETADLLGISRWALRDAVAATRAADLTAAAIVFGLGGLVWAPFTPVVYSFLQSGLEPDEQLQVVTLWTTGAMVAAP